MDQPANGGDLRVERATEGDGTGPMPAEFGGLYQAGYEAGYAKGREAGYEKGYAEGYREARPNARPKPEATVSSAPRRRGLLGLPCERCGTFLYSDETRCPHCDRRG